MRIILTMVLLSLAAACGVTNLSHDAAPTGPDGGTAAEGENCGLLDAGAVSCMTGLACCYPCGQGGCTNVCQVPCEEGAGCTDGCPQLP